MHGTTRTLITALAALGLAATSVACSGGPDQGTGAEQPTFRRAEGSHIAFDTPVSTTSDLLPPAGEGQPWTIVGSLLDPEKGAPVAAVWTSEDAKEWKREDIKPMRSGLGESMAAAVPTDDGLLAVGRLGDGDHSDAVVWLQKGDDDWKQIRPDAMGGDHEQWAFDVARGPGGILVAGGENVWGEVRARLWFSADGETWESVDGGPGGPLDATGEESVRDIASFGSGFVAVGSRRVDGEQDGIVWLSPDGKTWEEVDSPALGGAGRQDVTAVVDTGSGLVAGGFSAGDGPGVSVAWQSPDGRTWAPSPGGPLLPSSSARTATSDMTIRSLSVDGSGILATGGDRWRPDVWRSVDNGASWVPVGSPVHGQVYQDGVRLDDAAAANGVNAVAIGSGPSVMVLANRWEDFTTDAFPRGGTQPFASAVAAGPKGTVAAGGLYSPPESSDTREKFSGEVWLQARNGKWDTVNVDALASGQVLDVVAYKGGFAAVGTEDFSVANQRDISGDNGPDGMVWISPDGKNWGRIGSTDARIDDAYLQYLDDPSPENAATIVAMEADLPPESVAPAGGDGTRELSAAAPLLDGFIAVGTLFSGDDTDPIVLYSLDGTTLQGESPGVGGPGDQRLSDVCVGPDNVAVAVGVAGAAGGHEAAVIRRNPADGVWSVGTAEDGSFGGPGNQVAYACAAGPDGFVVVGSDDGSGDTDARIWTSKDGEEWTQVEAGALGGGGDQWASAVAAVPGGDDGNGWIVAGVDTEGGTRDIALWRLSPDGDLTRRDQGETALGGPGDQTASSVSVDEDGHVTVAGTDYGRVGLWESNKLDR
ncbi:MAG TPA: sialidase family protein [Acidimicrobiales bacterium]